MKTANAWFPSLHPRLAAALWIVWVSSPAFAFSLLGPYADWMDVEKGYRQGNEIGGPMNICKRRLISSIGLRSLP